MNRTTERNALAAIEREKERREARDLFAAMAMQGILASGGTFTSQSVAADAFAVADAMLAAREEEPTP